MNRLSCLLTLCFILWIGGACAATESDPEHVSATEFMEYVSLPIGTMVFSKCLGIAGGKAFVEVHKMSYFNQKEWSKKVYWVEVEALEPKDIELLQRLAE